MIKMLKQYFIKFKKNKFDITFFIDFFHILKFKEIISKNISLNKG